MKPFLLLLTIVMAPAAAGAAEFLVRPGGENKVVFVSKAPMEKFEGKTNRLEGRIVVNPTALGDSIAVHLEVDLASLDTGIAKRNRHMRENHLETEKHPKAVFEGATVLAPSGAALTPGTATSFEAEGTFTLHGVSRRLRVRVEATYLAAGTSEQIRFRTSFPVSLADHAIRRPEFLILKLADVQDVRVSGLAVAGP